MTTPQQCTPRRPQSVTITTRRSRALGTTVQFAPRSSKCNSSSVLFKKETYKFTFTTTRRKQIYFLDSESESGDPPRPSLLTSPRRDVRFRYRVLRPPALRSGSEREPGAARALQCHSHTTGATACTSSRRAQRGPTCTRENHSNPQPPCASWRRLVHVAQLLPAAAARASGRQPRPVLLAALARPLKSGGTAAPPPPPRSNEITVRRAPAAV